MAKEKMCPMSFNSHKETYYECQKKDCAWWDELAGLCAVVVIAQFGSEGSFYRHRQEQKESMNRARGG